MSETLKKTQISELQFIESDESICPLTDAPIGVDLRLCELCKGRRLARRLAEMGLTPGVRLRVVQDAGGPLLLSVRNSRMALGRGLADKLQVQVLDEHGAVVPSSMEKQDSELPETCGRRGRHWFKFGHPGRQLAELRSSTGPLQS